MTTSAVTATSGHGHPGRIGGDAVSAVRGQRATARPRRAACSAPWAPSRRGPLPGAVRRTGILCGPRRGSGSVGVRNTARSAVRGHRCHPGQGARPNRRGATRGGEFHRDRQERIHRSPRSSCARRTAICSPSNRTSLPGPWAGFRPVWRRHVPDLLSWSRPDNVELHGDRRLDRPHVGRRIPRLVTGGAQLQPVDVDPDGIAGE